jgi:hypothetical protein
MLGAAGFVLPEAFNKFGAVCGPEAVWWKVCRTLSQYCLLRFVIFQNIVLNFQT